MRITKARLIKLIQEEVINERRRTSVRAILSYQRDEMKNAPEGPLKKYVQWMAELMDLKDKEYMKHIDSLRKEIEALKTQKRSE